MRGDEPVTRYLHANLVLVTVTFGQGRSTFRCSLNPVSAVGNIFFSPLALLLRNICDHDYINFRKQRYSLHSPPLVDRRPLSGGRTASVFARLFPLLSSTSLSFSSFFYSLSLFSLLFIILSSLFFSSRFFPCVSSTSCAGRPPPLIILSDPPHVFSTSKP